MAFVDHFLTEEVADPWFAALILFLHGRIREIGCTERWEADGHQRFIVFQEATQFRSAEAHVPFDISERFE